MRNVTDAGGERVTYFLCGGALIRILTPVWSYRAALGCMLRSSAKPLASRKSIFE